MRMSQILKLMWHPDTFLLQAKFHIMDQKSRYASARLCISFQCSQCEQKTLGVIWVIVFRRMNNQDTWLDIPNHLSKLYHHSFSLSFCQRRKAAIRVSQKVKLTPDNPCARIGFFNSYLPGSFRMPAVTPS